MIDLMLALAMVATLQATVAPCDQSSTVAIEDCQQSLLAAANARLNAIYRERMAHLDPARRARLRAQERRWISLRDARCRVGPGQGTAGPLAAGNCLLTQTDARSRQLASGQ